MGYNKAIFDLGIIGGGSAGMFSALKIAKEDKKMKVILFELGRPFLKRRRALEGALGALPTSDGKLYINDLKKLKTITTQNRIKKANNYFKEYLSSLFSFDLIKDKFPSTSTLN